MRTPLDGLIRAFLCQSVDCSVSKNLVFVFVSNQKKQKKKQPTKKSKKKTTKLFDFSFTDNFAQIFTSVIVADNSTKILAPQKHLEPAPAKSRLDWAILGPVLAVAGFVVLSIFFYCVAKHLKMQAKAKLHATKKAVRKKKKKKKKKTQDFAKFDFFFAGAEKNFGRKKQCKLWRDYCACSASDGIHECPTRRLLKFGLRFRLERSEFENSDQLSLISLRQTNKNSSVGTEGNYLIFHQKCS